MRYLNGITSPLAIVCSSKPLSLICLSEVSLFLSYSMFIFINFFFIILQIRPAAGEYTNEH